MDSHWVRRVVAILALSFSCAAEMANAAGAAESPTNIKVVSAEFGTFDSSKPDEIGFLPTRVVPHRVGQRYGWVIDLGERRRSVSVREEYIVPNKAAVKQTSDDRGLHIDIPMERHNQVSQRQLVPVDGQILGQWEIGPNEPAGRRHLRVVVEEQTAADFEYEVK